MSIQNFGLQESKQKSFYCQNRKMTHWAESQFTFTFRNTYVDKKVTFTFCFVFRSSPYKMALYHVLSILIATEDLPEIMGKQTILCFGLIFEMWWFLLRVVKYYTFLYFLQNKLFKFLFFRNGSKSDLPLIIQDFSSCHFYCSSLQWFTSRHLYCICWLVDHCLLWEKCEILTFNYIVSTFDEFFWA